MVRPLGFAVLLTGVALGVLLCWQAVRAKRQRDAFGGHLLDAPPSPALLVDTSKVDQPFFGIGAISGGGATSRLLVDYPEPQRSEILDYLFKPNYGASLHILKVEIGGDSQSTDGTEASHMHSADDLDYRRGYEWWLLQEAKKRNPEIKTYGLPWAFPGWVGGPELSGSPFTHPELTSKYILKWLEGARDVYNIHLDYIGVWNERASDSKYAATLRKELDAAGFNRTVIVAKDGDEGICDDMAKDEGYLQAVGAVGLHYPSDFTNLTNCRNIGFGVKGGKPMWASEESSSYDDLNGAACWARIITSHWVLQGLTSSIMWDLVGSYFHGTAWYASSLMTAVQPWSGHYTVPEVVWATAHLTQFTRPGWNLIEVGSGSGQLPKGGFYATYADPDGKDWTLMVVKVDEDHARCTRPSLPHFDVASETATFRLAKGMRGGKLAVWYSNLEDVDGKGQARTVFQRQKDIEVEDGGSFTLRLPLGAVFTVSTILDGPTKGEPATSIPASQPSVPLPYSDDFESYEEAKEGKWWSDQIGDFEVKKDSTGNKVMRQMVPALPIGWSDSGTFGPVSVLGMREWEDITLTASFRLPASAPSTAAACIGTRADQMWSNGVVLCVAKDGNWTLTMGGPPLVGFKPDQVYTSGTVAALAGDGLTQVSLTTVAGKATATLSPCGNGSCSLFKDATIRDIDTGFAAIGANGWYAVEFDNISIEQAGSRWEPPAPGPVPKPGAAVVATACAPNGLVDASQDFDLLTDWGLLHRPSGLCAKAAGASEGSGLVLAPCKPQDPLQQFRNDYTNVRNDLQPFTQGSFLLSGSKTGSVSLQTSGHEDWQKWVYFPNTGQLRNQYVASVPLGYPLCLAVQAQKPAAEKVLQF